MTAKSIVAEVGGNSPDMMPHIFLELPSNSGHILQIAPLRPKFDVGELYKKISPDVTWLFSNLASKKHSQNDTENLGDIENTIRVQVYCS